MTNLHHRKMHLLKSKRNLINKFNIFKIKFKKLNFKLQKKIKLQFELLKINESKKMTQAINGGVNSLIFILIFHLNFLKIFFNDNCSILI